MAILMPMTRCRYLVLPSNVEHDAHYAELRGACAELMGWADPSYYYSGIAVTKNFVASPHIDDRDRSFQYAVSLGRCATHRWIDDDICRGQPRPLTAQPRGGGRVLVAGCLGLT
jgi:hypothetical protein